jgi:flagellar hook assembly protein FlgD
LYIEIEEQLIADTKSITIKAYPNPFNNETQFEITLLHDFTENQLDVNIYDISGKVIFSDNIQHISNSAQINYSWTGNDTRGTLVPKGTYMVIFSSKTFKQMVKVLKL